MILNYKTHGVCASQIDIEITGSKVGAVTFHGGCNGNHKGLSSLIHGMEIDDVIEKLSGITCAMRSTSCPDQLAQALIKSKELKKDEKNGL